MTDQNHLQHSRNHRPLACPTCTGCNPTLFQAFASDQMLEDFEAEHIGDLTDEDLLNNQRPDYCYVTRHCLACNGPDEPDCGDGEDFRDPA